MSRLLDLIDPVPSAEALSHALPRLRDAARTIDTRPLRGRITRAVGTVIHAVVPGVRIGELCRLEDNQSGLSLEAEVVGLTEHTAILTPIGAIETLSSRVEVVPTGRMVEVPVGPTLLGRILDSRGLPLDGGAPLDGAPTRPLRGTAPNPLQRQLIDRPMPLGVRVIDGLLTVGEGQRLGIYGEPGGGKSSLLAQIVKGTQAEICVIALIGERGREVREFVERHLGAAGLARSVLIVATSDRSAIERLQAAYAATAIAEHFRDAGRRVVLLMDSVTRFARALREIGLAAGEPPTRRGFPPSVFASLPGLMERAGPGASGSITAFYTVLVEGDGSGDPIAEETRGILDGHIVLSPALAAQNHYPAVDVLASRSRVMNAVAGQDHVAAAARVRELLARYQETEFLIQVGEYKAGSDPLTDAALARIGDLRGFLRQAEAETTPFEESIAWMQRLAA
ncbi:type III secretion system ATPase SctN [Methylobacterium sp. ARG-1]|uniref:type III secretion system ATPase SctN n=1 Tax=Methylobacterium sp. ARG-1 TaxID=1692501 RepID=UPI000680A4BC|nr:type III secretion system ATPase SctN [Methylobacterium sp. ARG-1]KNY19781.1 ATP synthase [Methylobacterium sp. ARG-1]